MNSYIELNFDVLHAATGKRYADRADKRLGNLCVIVLFSIYVLTTSSGKHFEEINHAHIVSLTYRLLTSSKASDDLSFGFDRSRDRRKQELTNNKTIKGNYHLKVISRKNFGFAEHQEQQFLVSVTI